MTPAGHLNPDEFVRYRLRTLTPAEFLRADDHLAECQACREQLFVEAAAGGPLRDLRAALMEHLDYSELEAAAQGSESPAAAAHLRECLCCREETGDLQRFRSELGHAEPVAQRRVLVPMPPRPSQWRVPAAAAALLAAALGYWALRQHAPSAVVYAPAPAPAAREHVAVLHAREARQLERASILDRLVVKRGVLLSAIGSGSSFEVLSPVGTALLDERPVFRWQALQGAGGYVVSVFDEDFRQVAESPAVKDLEWQPAARLPRGRVLNWQVTARTGDGVVHAPAPPAAEARFLVLDGDALAEIETARRDHPDDALLLAALCARAGALDDAAREVERLAATDAALAESLRASIKSMRIR